LKQDPATKSKLTKYPYSKTKYLNLKTNISFKQLLKSYQTKLKTANKLFLLHSKIFLQRTLLSWSFFSTTGPGHYRLEHTIQISSKDSHQN